jgi:hypothetical protein
MWSLVMSATYVIRTNQWLCFPEVSNKEIKQFFPNISSYADYSFLGCDTISPYSAIRPLLVFVFPYPHPCCCWNGPFRSTVFLFHLSWPPHTTHWSPRAIISPIPVPWQNYPYKSLRFLHLGLLALPSLYNDTTFFVCGILFYLEDGGSAFLLNVTKCLPDYGASHPSCIIVTAMRTWKLQI